MLLYIPMVRLLILATFLSVFSISASKAAKLFYSASAQKIIINEVSLGEEITVNESDLTELVNDIKNDSDNIDGTIFIRVFLKTADRSKIENIIKAATKTPDNFEEPLIEITKTPDTNATRTKIKYAQVDRSRPVSGSLIYNWADSIQCLESVDRYTFSVKNFTEIERNSIVMFQIDIDDVWNYAGTLKFTIKLLNEPSTSTGGDSGSGGSGGDGGTGGDGGSGGDAGGTTSGGNTAAVASALQSFSARVTSAQVILNKNYLCNPTETTNTQNICSSSDLQTLSTNLNSRIAEARTNKTFFESLRFTIRQEKVNKNISKLQNRSLQTQIKKALIINTAALKELKLMKSKIDKFTLNPNTFEPIKRQKALLAIRSRAQSRINRVDSLVNSQIAGDLLTLGIIDQATFSSL